MARIGNLPRASANAEAGQHALLLAQLVRTAGHVPIAVRLEVFRVPIDADFPVLWSWRAVHPTEGIVAESGQSWPAPQPVFRYLVELFPAATVSIVDRPGRQDA